LVPASSGKVSYESTDWLRFVISLVIPLGNRLHKAIRRHWLVAELIWVVLVLDIYLKTLSVTETGLIWILLYCLYLPGELHPQEEHTAGIQDNEGIRSGFNSH